MKMTTKSIYNLNKGESTVLCVDDIEFDSAIKISQDYPDSFQLKTKDEYAIIITKL